MQIKEQAAGQHEDAHLRQPAQENARDLAAEDLGRRNRCAQEGRQGAFLALGQDASPTLGDGVHQKKDGEGRRQIAHDRHFGS